MKKISYWILSAAVVAAIGLGWSTTTEAAEAITEAVEITAEQASTTSFDLVPPLFISSKPDDPQNFYVCGDGVCSQGGPFGENSQNCPQDCGGGPYPTC